MNNSKEEAQLSPQVVDYVTSAVKAIVGAAPFAGSLLAEVAGTIIPNQRIDRIAAFAEALEERLSILEQDDVRSQLENPHFTDLVEEGIRQASRSSGHCSPSLGSSAWAPCWPRRCLTWRCGFTLSAE